MTYKLGSILIVFLGSCSLALAQGSAFLGIEYDQLSQGKLRALNIKEPNGSYITNILGNSTADNAGLQPMDYLFGIDDKRTSRFKDIGDLLRSYKTGDRATLHYYRKGKPQSAYATFVSRNQTYRKDTPDENAFLGVSPHSNNNGDELGMRVSVVRNSTAQVMGVRSGDIILALNGYPIVNWVDISLAMKLFRPGETVAVDLEREGQRKTLKSILLSEEEREALSNCRDCENKKAYLGFYSDRPSRRKAERLGFDNPYGVYISKVIPGTAAEKYDLQPFDYIYGVDEYRVGKEQSITSIFSKYYAGEKATLYIVRKGKNQKLPIVFGQRSDSDEDYNGDPCEKPFLGVQQAYGQNERGVQVNPVRNSTAEAMGIEDGDIITEINGYPMIDWEDITIALGMVQAGDQVEVTWLHNGARNAKTLPIKSSCDTKGSSRSSQIYIDEDDKQVMTFSDQSLKGMHTRLSTLSEQQVQEVNSRLDLNLSEEVSLKVDKFSLVMDRGQDEYRIQFSLPEKGNTQLRLFNDKGRVVYAYDLGEFVGDFSDRIDISSNGPGVYFLEILQDRESSVYEIELRN